MSLYLHDLVQNEIGLRGMEFTCEAMALPKNLSPEPILKLPLTVSLSHNHSHRVTQLSLNSWLESQVSSFTQPDGRKSPARPWLALSAGATRLFTPRLTASVPPETEVYPTPEAGCTRCPPPARPLLPSSHLLPLLSGFFFDTFFTVLLAQCNEVGGREGKCLLLTPLPSIGPLNEPLSDQDKSKGFPDVGQPQLKQRPSQMWGAQYLPPSVRRVKQQFLPLFLDLYF